MNTVKAPYFLIFLVVFLIGYLAFLPNLMQYIDVSSVYDHKRLINISFLSVVAIIVLINGSLQKNWIEMWTKFPVYIRWILIGILCIGFISTLFSPFPVWALIEITQFVLLFVMMICIAVLVQNHLVFMKQILLLICVAFAFLILFQTGFSIIKSYISIYPDVPFYEAHVGTFGFSHLRFFNQVQTVTIPLMGVAVIYGKKFNKSSAVTVFILLCGWWLLVFISGARGTLLAVTVGIMIAGFLNYRFKSNWLKVQLFSFIISVGAYFLIFYSPGASGRSITRDGTTGRLQWWWETVLGIIDKPLIGYGPMQSSIEGFGLHGHNYFLTIAYEWGLPVAVLFTGILLFALYKFQKNEKNNEPELNKVFNTGILASLIAIWIHSLVSDLFKTPMGQIWIILITGYAIGIYYKNKEVHLPSLTSIYNWKLTIFLGGILSIFIWSVYPSMTSFKEREKEYIEQYQRHVLLPRFWQQGKIGWEDKQKNEEINKEYLGEN